MAPQEVITDLTTKPLSDQIELLLNGQPLYVTDLQVQGTQGDGLVITVRARYAPDIGNLALPRLAHVPMVPKVKQSKLRLVYVPPRSLPKGLPCQVCKKKARPGQTVYFQRFEILNTNAPEVRFLIHKKCVGMLSGDPEIIGTKAEVEYEYNRQATEIALAMERDGSF